MSRIETESIGLPSTSEEELISAPDIKWESDPTNQKPGSIHEAIALAMVSGGNGGGNDGGPVGTEPDNIYPVQTFYAGAVKTDSFTVVAIPQNLATSVKLVYSTSPNFLNARTTAAKATQTVALRTGIKHIVKLTVTGLAPNQVYYYAVEIGGSRWTMQTGKIKTAPALGQSYTRRVIFLSCETGGIDADDSIFDLMLAEEPDQIVHMGDLHYTNIATYDPGYCRESLFRVLSKPRKRALYSNSSFFYTYDDHDSGPNDQSITTPGFTGFTQAHIEAYRDFVPHYEFQQPDGVGWTKGIAQAFDLGAVRFVAPDLRFQSDYAQGESYSGTAMGDGLTREGLATWDQLQWFKETLLQAKLDGIKLVIFVSSRTYNGGRTSAEYGGTAFASERDDIAEFICNNDVPEVLIAQGDAHWSYATDGTDPGLTEGFQYDTTNGAGQIPAIMSSYVTTGGDQGSYFPNLGAQWAAKQTGYRLSQAYTVIDFTYDGESQRVSYSGRIVRADLGTTEPRNEFANTDMTPVVGFTSAAYTVAGSAGFVEVEIERSWFGAFKVDIATEDGTAISGNDYTALAETITAHPHRVLTRIPIPIIESGPTPVSFTVTLSNPDGATLGLSTCVVTITP